MGPPRFELGSPAPKAGRITRLPYGPSKKKKIVSYFNVVVIFLPMINFRIVKNRRGKFSIIVTCPKCGREGYLRVYSKRGDEIRAFKIVHEKFNRGCHIGINSEYFEELFELHKAVREFEKELAYEGDYPSFRLI